MGVKTKFWLLNFKLPEWSQLKAQACLDWVFPLEPFFRVVPCLRHTHSVITQPCISHSPRVLGIILSLAIQNIV